jgi:hypothetical protein
MWKQKIYRCILGLGLVFVSYMGFAQDLSGLIQGENAFILVRPSTGQTFAELIKAWGLTGTPDTSKNDVFVPLAGKLQYDACSGCLPVYHEVKKGDVLFRITQWYSLVTMNKIKSLNSLRTNSLRIGQQLLIGYLLPPNDSSDFSYLNKDNKSKTARTEAVRQNREIPFEDVVPELTYRGEGVFETEWKPSVPINLSAGKASVFKTGSGWQDGRFYLLHSTLETGQVVKLTEPISGKFIYAKVVGPLPEIKMNNGLITRVNSAAAATLGISNDDTFEILIQY